MKIKIGFVSLGCPKNLTDTETMLGILGETYEIVTNPKQADIIIINTCGFIESAKQESIDTIIEMGAYKQTGRLKKLIVTGCMAQRYSGEILEIMPEVDAVVGTASYVEIARVVRDSLDGKRDIYCADINSPVDENLPRILSTPSYSAYLKIADGCSNKCTYCIIPKLRGRYRSRTVESIVSEAKSLADGGVREIILIAQDTTMYGVDIYKKKMLATLLEKLSEIPQLHWIRIHYCYPELIDNDLIDAMKNLPKVCKYIDIPFQHADNGVLKRMGRRSSFEKNIELIRRLKTAMPDITVRSSFITGFPGETEEEFEMLRKFIMSARLDRLGVFAYSAEEDTPAAEFDFQIDEETKLARRDEIMRLQQKISHELCEEKIGKTVEVLCEGKVSDNVYIGRTEGDSPEIDGRAVIKSKMPLSAGDFVKIKITKASDYDLEGDFVEYTE